VGAVIAIVLVGAPAAADRMSPYARIIDIQVEGTKSFLTMNRGSEQGIAEGWRAWLVKPGGERLPHGDFVIFRVTKRTCIGAVAIDAEEIRRGNYLVELEPR
jgi:hypothetical protein